MTSSAQAHQQESGAKDNLFITNRELALRFLVLLAERLELFDRFSLQNFRQKAGVGFRVFVAWLLGRS